MIFQEIHIDRDLAARQIAISTGYQRLELEREMLEHMPRLRRFAHRLAGNRANADDLLQETLLRALGNFHRFAAGSNMRAWLCTIMRNAFYSSRRKLCKEMPYDPDAADMQLAVRPPQEGVVAVAELAALLRTLPKAQHNALLLVAVSGLSYERAAQVSGCALGTMKSRVCRARSRLLEAMPAD